MPQDTAVADGTPRASVVGMARNTMTRAQKAAETRRRNRESRERIARAQAETRAVVATGKCPCCGSALRRNLSITGWWQCEQYGADSHRARPADPQCEWQGFTE